MRTHRHSSPPACRGKPVGRVPCEIDRVQFDVRDGVTKAALPSLLPKPRRGRSRGCTSNGCQGDLASDRLRIRRIIGNRQLATQECLGMAVRQCDLVVDAGASRHCARRRTGARATPAGAAAWRRRNATASSLEIARFDAGDVFAAETRGIEHHARELRPGDRLLQVRQSGRSASQPIIRSISSSLQSARSVRRRHVDAIDVRVPHSGAAGEVHLARAGVARHLHDLRGVPRTIESSTSSTAIAELQRDRIELRLTDFTRSPCPGMMKVRPT